jgi:lysophospholipid acyltransferase (LPLAT)-like uncharacterized protein
MKKAFKKFLKENECAIKIITILLYSYLQFVYFTSRKKFIFHGNTNKKQLLAQQGVIFAFWHNILALSPVVFRRNNNIHALISPHLDGRFLHNIVRKFGCGVIIGSSNKNPVSALKQIIQKLSKGANVIITPDGPKGPVYKINSNITEIAYKYDKKLIPIVANTSRYFLLKSWDKLIIPLPFGRIQIIIGLPLDLINDKKQNDINLQQQLIHLASEL